MRPLPLVLLLSAALAGCGDKRFLLDRSVPAKTGVIAAELVRYGLSPVQTQCTGRALAERLSVWELRQLGAALAQRRSGGEAGPPDLWAIIPQIRHQAIGTKIAEALGGCGIAQDRPAARTPAAPAPSGPQPVPQKDTQPDSRQDSPQDPGPHPEQQASRAPALASPPAQSPSAPPPPSADGKLQNGPSDYRPSEALLQALEAYERSDYAAAVRLARNASEGGDSGAQQFLGGLYAAGQGVRADVGRAVHYYALAAEQGWSEAMNNLAKAYETGFGIGRDPVEALKWYLLASARATEDEGLVAANMHGLLARMSLADIERAGALAHQWEAERAR